jgi:hypothetical protein
MVKCFLIPVLAAALQAQQAAPAADAETALRARVQQFYRLQQEKKFRQSEAMIADDTKDDYYASRKPDIKGFTIEKVELQKDSTEAKVTIKVKVVVLMPGAGGQIFDMTTPTYWKIEAGEWRWCIPADVKVSTPFGKMKTGDSGADVLNMKGAAPGGLSNPNLGALLGQVSADATSVELSADAPDSVVTITNGLPGPTDLRIDPHVETIKGLVVKLDKTRLEQGEKVAVHFHFSGTGKISDIVEIVAMPLNRPLDITVRTK